MCRRHRDLKNEHFGLGLSATHIGRTDCRDRLLMVASLAHAFLTLLGAASERSGLDRTMVSSTKRGRVYSLFNQGLFWYRGLPNLKPERLRTLMNAFAEILVETRLATAVTGIL